jgi:hypothetical protein
MPTDDTPRQKKQALYPANCCSMGARLKKIGVNDFAQFRMRHTSRLSIDHQNLFDIGMLQAFEQNTFPDHAGRAGDDGPDCHGVPYPTLPNP